MFAVLGALGSTPGASGAGDQGRAGSVIGVGEVVLCEVGVVADRVKFDPGVGLLSGVLPRCNSGSP